VINHGENLCAALVCRQEWSSQAKNLLQDYDLCCSKKSSTHGGGEGMAFFLLQQALGGPGEN
jgi:hypothetical protein